MKISKIHQMFSDYLEEPRVLTNPEDFLGPNWKDVINFWFYIDGLTKEEREKIRNRYLAIDYHVREAASDASRSADYDVVGMIVGRAAWDSSWVITGFVFGHATREIIASHKLLEQDKTLVALQHIMSFSQ
jgi:hypothetical protein